MGVTLRYAKVLDAQRADLQAGQIRNDDNYVCMSGAAPAAAEDFYVARAWEHADGPFTETWRIDDPHGLNVRDTATREFVGDQEVADVITGQEFDYGSEGYQLILEIDGREVARVDFEVREPEAE